MRKISMLVLLAMSLALCASSLWGQIEVGRITGTVTDQSGAVINGAKVTLTNNATGVSITKGTADGVYAFPAVQPGVYTLRIESEGFASHVTNNIEVHVQQTNTVDAQLRPGKVSEQVVVDTTAPLLKTETADVGQTITAITVDSMPLNGRNWTSLGLLAAGVNTAQPGYSNDGATGNPSAGYYSVNGQALGTNDFRLNGVGNMAIMFGAAAAIQPPPDAIEEFKIQTGDYSAEFGHGIGGVINAVVRSGTNQLHGNLYDYFRNDALDAKDYFSAQQGARKPELRQNQFGGMIGGPIYIPGVYNGKNKSFFFFDYQERRAISPTSYFTVIPSNLMQSSNFTNLQDLITYSSGSNTDALGRMFPTGTVLDPATTRQIAAGGVDPVTGLTNTSTGPVYVRDPFYAGSLAGVTDFTTAGIRSQLNMLPSDRIDPNALALLNLFPAPTNDAAYFAGNYFKNFRINDKDRQYDIRIDHNFSDKDTISGFFSWSKTDSFTENFLPGVLNGGNYYNGNYINPHKSVSGSYTHVFSPTLTNEFRLAYNKQYRSANGGPEANTLGIPEQYGIQGIPQFAGNGGLPIIGIAGLAGIGPSGWTPTIIDERNVQIIDNFTKIYGKHVLKGGFEINSAQGDILQPAFGRGDFSFSGNFTDVPNANNGTTGIAQFLLAPITSTVGGVDFLGGPNSVSATSANWTRDHRWYNAAYVEDAFKVTPTFTINLGLRYDLFTPYADSDGHQANFIPNNGNGPGGAYYIPEKSCGAPINPAFEPLLNANGIRLVCSSGMGTGTYGKKNFAPRVGFAKRITSRYVLRAGFGIAYGQLDSIGYGPNIGQNYPFYYNVGYGAQNDVTPLRFPDPNTGTFATLETGLSPITPDAVDPHGMGLISRYPYAQRTPYSQTYNLSNQYEITHNDSIQVAYVGSVSRHTTTLTGANSPSLLLLPGTILANNPGKPNFIPFPDFGGTSLHNTSGMGSYNSAQVVYEHRFSSGLQALANYTFARCLSNGGPQEVGLGARGLFLPGFGQRAEYSNCPENVLHTVHFSGTYKLPFGPKMRWQGNSVTNAVLGGWQLNWIYSYQSGNWFGIGCTQATTTGMGCFANVTGDPYADGRNVNKWLNASAFTNPTPPTAADADANGVLFNQQNFGLLGTTRNYAFNGPSFYNVDFSIFKEFHVSEADFFQFRAEAFNMLNNPQFNNPSHLNFTGDPSFGKITGVRNGGRIVQFALKFYF